jgi:hypothetical protein
MHCLLDVFAKVIASSKSVLFGQLLPIGLVYQEDSEQQVPTKRRQRPNPARFLRYLSALPRKMETDL